jgi:hypothetical protein
MRPRCRSGRLTLSPTMTPDPTMVPPFPRLRLVAHAEGFKAPESVLHDRDQDVYFVSNINGPNDARDNNGFVSRMRPEGSIEKMMLVAGGDDACSPPDVRHAVDHAVRIIGK